MKFLKGCSLLIIVIIACLMSHLANGQDIIIQKDGSKIEAIIIEVGDFVKFKRYEQRDGPLRSTDIRNIERIIYESGREEVFIVRTVQQATRTRAPRVRRKFKGLDHRGFFIEGIAGYTKFRRMQMDYSSAYWGAQQVEQEDPWQEQTVDMVNFGMKLGYKWYLQSPEYRTNAGVQFTALRFELGVGDGAILNLSPLNVGACGILKLNEDIGFEGNFSTGLALTFMGSESWLSPTPNYFSYGVNINPQVKFRYKEFALGLEYRGMIGETESKRPTSREVTSHSFSLTLGRKF